MRKNLFKETERHNEANQLIGDSGMELSRFYVMLGNIFYDCAYPIEKYEWQNGVDTRALRAEIIEETRQSFKKAAALVNRIERNDTKEILTAGLRGVLTVSRDYISKGSVRGNGHHARQEASSNAIIKIHKLINGK